MKEGISVCTSGGEEVGKINRFVLDPQTNDVTHIVVQRGWLLSEDKVVPIHMINSATKDRVPLYEDVQEFDELPPFEEMRSLLKEEDYEPTIIVDASVLYEMDDRTQLESLINEKIVWQVPAETSAAYFIIETAERFNGLVISNDRYQSYLDKYPRIEERRSPLMIIQGRVELYEPKLEQIREQEK